MYIGYQPKMDINLARFQRKIVLCILLLGMLLAAGLAWYQSHLAGGTFEWGQTRSFEGVLHEKPYPSLAMEVPGGAPLHVLLVSPFKFGAESWVQGLDGKQVRLDGTLISRHGQLMIEGVPESLEVLQSTELYDDMRSLGRITLVGEIVDSKCYYGVMNPGNLKGHKDCAIRCISGGIPPVFLVRDEDGNARTFLLTQSNGKAWGKEILDWVARPMRIHGFVEKGEFVDFKRGLGRLPCVGLVVFGGNLQDHHDLVALLNSRVPIILIESDEEERVVALFQGVEMDAQLPVFKWSVTRGLCRLQAGFAPQKFNTRPEEVLGHISSMRKPGIFLLLDFHPFLEDPVLVRSLREIALHDEMVANRIVLVSPRLDLPVELKSLSARFELNFPSSDKIKKIVENMIAEWNASGSGDAEVDDDAVPLLCRALQGLTLTDAERLARKAIFDDGAITESDIANVQKAKYNLIDQNGVLHFEFETARFADVGGLENMKKWLKLRRNIFISPKDHVLDPPKGVLLLGVQGCGKSLAAKAVAGVWGVPLLRLDFGSLYNKYYGETERNLRESLKTAEVMAPCVLWIDEIEKGISGGGDDGGVSKRVLGTLLTWMAERKQPVFLVATANDISALPPELLRKGRFDEIFFVDLPDLSIRAEILAIHMQKRKLDPKEYNLHLLATLSEGFSGAEIEQALVGALYSSLGTGQEMSTALVAEQLKNTKPLSVLMAERIESLREWASTRTTPA